MSLLANEYRLMTSSDLSGLSVRQLVGPSASARDRRVGPERTLRGVLLSKGRRCSSEGCRCRRGELHGPYSYLSVYAEGRSRTVYVPGRCSRCGRGARRGDAAQRRVAFAGLADQS